MSYIDLFTCLRSTKSVAEWGLGMRLCSALCSLQCVPSPQLCVCVTVPFTCPLSLSGSSATAVQGGAEGETGKEKEGDEEGM